MDEKRKKWMMLFLSFMISFLLHLLLFGTAPMVDLIMEEMNLSHADFGFIFSTAMISLVVLRVPWGIAVDKYGYLKIFKISLPVIAIGAVLRGLSTGYFTLLFSQFLLGLGLASVLPCLPSIVKEWFPSRTGFATGVYVSGFAFGNGTALGLTPFLLKITGWRTILSAYGLLAVIISLLWWGFAKGEVKKCSKYELEDFFALLKNKYVWLLTFFMIASMGGYDTLATWMPKVLELKMLRKSPALLLSLGFLLSGPSIGALSDRIRNEKNLVSVLGLAATASIVSIIYLSFPYLLASLFFSGFFLMGILTLTLKVPARSEEFSSSAGRVSGIFSSLGNIGPMTMPVAFGFLIDVTANYVASIFMVAIVSFLTIFLGSRFWTGTS